MKLYWCPQTRSSRAVWMLEEAGVDYELVHCDITKPERDSGTSGREPDGQGSGARGRRREDVGLGGDLPLRRGPLRRRPAGAGAGRSAARPLRALADLLAGDDRAGDVRVGPSGPSCPKSTRRKRSTPARLGWGSFAKTIEVWEQGLGDSPWILGDEFSAADVMLGSSAVLPAHVRNAAGVAGARGLRRPLHGQAGVPEGAGGGGSRLSAPRSGFTRGSVSRRGHGRGIL